MAGETLRSIHTSTRGGLPSVALGGRKNLVARAVKTKGAFEGECPVYQPSKRTLEALGKCSCSVRDAQGLGGNVDRCHL